MNQRIREYAIGYYNDDRVNVIRNLENGGVMADYDAAKFILDYDRVMTENLKCWRQKISDKQLNRKERAQLAAELLKANPIGWTDGQALDVLARRFVDMVKSARGYTERIILSNMLSKSFHDLIERMEEFARKDADDDRWFNDMLDRELLEDDEADNKVMRGAGQAPSD